MLDLTKFKKCPLLRLAWLGNGSCTIKVGLVVLLICAPDVGCLGCGSELRLACMSKIIPDGCPALKFALLCKMYPRQMHATLNLAGLDNTSAASLCLVRAELS